MSSQKLNTKIDRGNYFLAFVFQNSEYINKHIWQFTQHIADYTAYILANRYKYEGQRS